MIRQDERGVSACALPHRWAAAMISVTAIMTVMMAVVGCGVADTSEPAAEPTPLTGATEQPYELARIEFCDLIEADTVAEALGPDESEGKPALTSWSNGDAVTAAGAGRQRVQEAGCQWKRGKSKASAWLFARDVRPSEAKRWTTAAIKRKGCKGKRVPIADGGYEQTCPLPKKKTRARLAGLFGDNWLTCELIGPKSSGPESVAKRADLWCAGVVAQLNLSG